MIAADMEVRPVPSASQAAATEVDWRRQSHTAFLALVVFLNVCLDLAALRPEGGEWMIGLWVGILLAQTFLMGLWMAFGGLHALWRAFLIACITVGGAWAASVSLGSSFGGVKGAFWAFVPVAGTIVLATHALLLPARMLTGWRIDFNPAYHASRSNLRMQFRLVDCIGLMTAVALPLALARLSDANLLWAAAVGGGSALLSALPIVYLIVVPRRSDKTWLVAAVVLSGFIVAEYSTFWFAFNGQVAVVLPFHLGLAVMLLLNLLPLRCLFGLHLFSVAPGARRDVVRPIPWRPVDPDLAALAEAWPTLPEPVRHQIVALANIASAWPSLPDTVRRQIMAAANGANGAADF